MKHKFISDVYDKILAGLTIGIGCGIVVTPIATIWGGYELGSTINDYLKITNNLGRGTLDIIMMGLIAKPAFKTCFCSGAIIGSAIGAISHPIIEGVRDISDCLSYSCQKKRLSLKKSR